ncbi:MAG: Mitochondrial GTPase [Pleopsidium flavum]|nr:MAG: Mitochondrial GTPase [Pleopsidium flavum]
MASFIPRAVFPTLDSLPRSYFLGHHRAGLTKMKAMLSSVDMVIECRDYRVPLTSQNPLFEENLAGKERLVVYTKQDLGSEGREEDRSREEIIRRWHHPSQVVFSAHKNKTSVREVLKYARERASFSDSLTGSRMMIVGMPNVGKSSMLNALRLIGMRGQKAAQTGAQPGVTRKIASSVKIAENAEGEGKIYLVDTPGVFIPYVPDAESMLKLALCGSVKDTIIPPTTLADYLLYRLNLTEPLSYSRFTQPTNDVVLFLGAIAHKTGRLQRGGIPDLEGTALWIIQKWRAGYMGRFVLDDVTEDALDQRRRDIDGLGRSMNQAKQAEKDVRRQRSRQRHLDNG